MIRYSFKELTLLRSIATVLWERCRIIRISKGIRFYSFYSRNEYGVCMNSFPRNKKGRSSSCPYQGLSCPQSRPVFASEQGRSKPEVASDACERKRDLIIKNPSTRTFVVSCGTRLFMERCGIRVPRVLCFPPWC